MHSRIIKFGILWIIILTSVISWWIVVNISGDGKMVLESEKRIAEKTEKVRNEDVLKNIAEKEVTLFDNKENATEVVKTVPFSSQAPLGKWDAYHQEACEETALIMIKYYMKGKELTPVTAEEEIQKIIAFQIERYGKYEDSSAEEIVLLAEDFYGIHNLKVIYDFDQEKLLEYLSQGKPIIIPAAGRMLRNPNFKSPGPLYHALVLVGLENGKVITNDPGTKNGRNYAYDANLLYKAIHDFSGNLEEIEGGRKAMIVFE